MTPYDANLSTVTAAKLKVCEATCRGVTIKKPCGCKAIRDGDNASVSPTTKDAVIAGGKAQWLTIQDINQRNGMQVC